MKTKIKVDFYKESGKWYTSIEFETAIPVFETQELIEKIEIRRVGQYEDMSYTFIAESEIGINMHLVKK